jgi:hypothetical protein
MIQVLEVMKTLPGKLIIETEILVHSVMNSNSRCQEGWPVDIIWFVCNRSALICTAFMTKVRTDEVLSTLVRCISATCVLASALENC